ncbi:MAG: ABC transporter permease [Proteobacteria bacterium]|nr:ABC transporter permease [Pseudomonadota bacterium]
MRAPRGSDLWVLLAVWAGLVALFGAFGPGFLSAATFGSVANRIPALLLTATGMTLVMVTGGIDLSVGSVLGLCGAVVGVTMVDAGGGLAAALAASIAVGTALGAANGLVSVKLRLPSFIVTLGMLEIARGLAFLTTHSQTKYIGAAVEGLGTPLAGLVVSPAFLIALAGVAAGQGVLSLTVWGRHLVAVGANAEAAAIAGIDVDRPRIWAHALLGALTGVAAVCNCSRLGSADPNAGVGFELSVIAAVVVGGTSLAGGRGSVAKSFLGVLIVATLEAGLVQLGASEPVKRVVTGGVIVAAVLADTWRRRA